MKSSETYRTTSASPADVNRKWYLIDASEWVLGRLSTRLSTILQGKNKPDYTPHINTGDKVIVINAEKIRLTGKKMDDKQYISHTGYPGGQRSKTPRNILDTKPEEVLRMSVKGMLPKNKLQKPFLANLHIYAGESHPHTAQKPEKIEAQ